MTEIVLGYQSCIKAKLHIQYSIIIEHCISQESYSIPSLLQMPFYLLLGNEYLGTINIHLFAFIVSL